MFLLEGNMGAGKSTLLSLIQRHLPELKIVFEPLQSWNNNSYGQSLMTNFYQDRQRWSYTMEKQTLLARIKQYLEETQDQNPRKIMERSIYSGYYCFAKNGYLGGTMDPEEWQAYNTWFKFLINSHQIKPLGFIYLFSTPEICQSRIQKRNRNGEDSVSLAYLRELHNTHEAFLSERTQLLPELKNIPVLKLDVQTEFANNPALVQAYLAHIENFINETIATSLAHPNVHTEVSSHF